MSKYNQSVVEVTKIINDKPFETLWIYCETDIIFNITGSSSTIIVRSNDKVLSGSSASIVVGGSTSSLPIGTYSIGTDSNPYPLSGYDDYELISITAGYVSHILNNGETMSSVNELYIPNEGEEDIEWYCTISDLRPIIKTASSTGYVDGASYSNLKIRN